MKDLKVLKYHKLSIPVEAIQWDGTNLEQIKEFSSQEIRISTGGTLIIYTDRGWINAYVGDMVIKGLNDEVYACSETIFNLTYTKDEEYHEL